MTYLAVVAGIVTAFAVGFLLGNRRSVKQANEILDTGVKELFKAIGDEQPVCPADDAEPARPTMH